MFGPDDEAKVYLSSADWMPRNFYRRVEVMFPIEAAELKDRILHEIVPAYLRDNVKARVLQPDGTYVRSQPPTGEPPLPLPGAAAGDPSQRRPRARAAAGLREFFRRQWRRRRHHCMLTTSIPPSPTATARRRKSTGG